MPDSALLDSETESPYELAEEASLTEDALDWLLAESERVSHCSMLASLAPSSCRMAPCAAIAALNSSSCSVKPACTPGVASADGLVRLAAGLLPVDPDSASGRGDEAAARAATAAKEGAAPPPPPWLDTVGASPVAGLADGLPPLPMSVNSPISPSSEAFGEPGPASCVDIAI